MRVVLAIGFTLGLLAMLLGAGLVPALLADLPHGPALVIWPEMTAIILLTGLGALICTVAAGALAIRTDIVEATYQIKRGRES